MKSICIDLPFDLRIFEALGHDLLLRFSGYIKGRKLMDDSKKYLFHAILEPVAGKGGAYVRVPYDIREKFSKGRLKVHAWFDGIPYDGSIVNMGVRNEDGSVCYILGVRKDIRERMGKGIGEEIEVKFIPIL